MSKKIFYFFVLTFSLSLFSACSDDDDDDDVVDYAQQIAATYNGDLTVKIEEMQLPATNKDIKLTRTATNRAKLELNDFSLPQFDEAGNPVLGEDGNPVVLPLGNIVINDVVVSKVGDDIKLAEKTEKIQLSVGGVPLGEFSIKASGVYTGNKLNLDINVADTPSGNVDVKYTGTKK